MGRPANLGTDDAREADALAQRIYDAVDDDEAFPIAGLSEIDQGRVLGLAQRVLQLRRGHDARTRSMVPIRRARRITPTKK